MNKLMNKVRKNKKGFTLIELIVVIAILGILVLLAAPRFLGYTKDAQKATMQADAKVLSNAALVYNIENEGKWPVVVDEEGNEVETKVTIELNDGSTVDVPVADLKADAFDEHVQTLKNDISGYKMVTKRTTVNDIELQEGDILYEAGVEDRAGNTHYGVQLKIEKPADETEVGED